MKIVFLNGGLANQVFQYIFYRFGQIRHPEDDWFLDDSFFFVHNVHNGYELEKVFGLHPALLSRTFDADVWEYMIQLKRDENKSIPQILFDNGTILTMVYDTPNYDEWNPFDGLKAEVPPSKFSPEAAKVKGDVYYHGYWIDAGWYRNIANELDKELVFPEITEPHNLEYLKMIQGTESCSIHIRRGDYLNYGVSAPDKFYLEWIKDMLQAVPDMTLFVFSDDLEYCRTHTNEMGLDLPKEVIFIEGNKGDMAFRDMQLMSNCKNMINANSAFCYLAAILNKNLIHYISPPNRNL